MTSFNGKTGQDSPVPESSSMHSLLDTLFGQHPDGVIVCDARKTITWLNKSAERLLGMSPGEGVGKDVTQAYYTSFETDRTRCENACSKVFSTKRPFQNMQILICKSATNREYLVLETATPIIGGNGDCTGAVLVLKDFTVMAEEIRLPYKMESLRTLAGGLANDFNNLLTIINNSLFMARSGQDPESELGRMLSDAEKASFQAATLTNRLLSIAGGGQPVFTELDLKQVINNTTGFVVTSASINYDIEADDDLELVSADRGMIDQAIVNVLTNAVQALPDGGEISVRANNLAIDSSMPLAFPPGEYVCVSISDNGKGIPPENRTRVFDPFFTTKPGKQGLGLTLVYSAIRLHNGYVTVESNKAGTTVSMYLPSLKRKGAVKPEKSSNKGRILFMDDEKLLCQSAEVLFTYLGYKTVSVHNGDEALYTYREALMSSTPFDLVILDLKVSQGRGGADIIEELLAFDGNAKVLISSGLINDQVVVDHEKYGFRGAIIKPYDIAEMNAILAKILKT